MVRLDSSHKSICCTPFSSMAAAVGATRRQAASRPSEEGRATHEPGKAAGWWHEQPAAGLLHLLPATATAVCRSVFEYVGQQADCCGSLPPVRCAAMLPKKAQTVHRPPQAEGGAHESQLLCHWVVEVSKIGKDEHLVLGYA